MPRLAVLGHPVAHSRSPAMQNAALAALGLGEEWSYEAIDVAPEEFERRLRGLPTEGFGGVNVTVPHKQLALALADERSEVALKVGAANTLVFAGDAIEAYNTDAPGLIAALPGSPRGKSALVLGAGGAARAAVWALRDAGATVDIWNRTHAKAETVHLDLGGLPAMAQAEEVGEPVLEPDQTDYELIVNTTSVGLHGEDPFDSLPLDPDGFGEQVVVDMVYGNEPSTLLAVAEAAGATVVDGLEILVRQGALSLQIWTGRDAPLDVMRTAARA
jgi:shikimate dehydrogenase